MANYKTGAQRYNDRMDKIFERSKELNMKYHGKDEFGSKKHEKGESKAREKKEHLARKMKGENWKVPDAVKEWERKRDENDRKPFQGRK